jgi:hypothetical protein
LPEASKNWYMSRVYVDWLLAASQHKRVTHTNCCIYRLVPPDDEQWTCSKHLEVNYWNKLKVNTASCWLLLCRYITMCGKQNTKWWCSSVVSSVRAKSKLYQEKHPKYYFFYSKLLQ